MRAHCHRWLILVAAVVAGGLVVQAAEACRCREPTVQQAYIRADLIVVATIDGVDASDDIVSVRATITDTWKASTPPTITFVSGESCIYPVHAGEKHVLFLTRGPDGSLGTIRCHGNRSLDDAKKILSWLKRYGKRAAVEVAPRAPTSLPGASPAK